MFHYRTKYKFLQALIWLVLGSSLQLKAQWAATYLEKEQRVRVTPVPSYKHSNVGNRSAAPSLMTGFPLVFSADPAFKNFRNVTLADLDDIPGQEIIAGIHDQLFVLKQDSIWWNAALSGVARFPVSVGDLEPDGRPDVIVLTGYRGAGGAYAFEADGSTKPGWPRSFDGHTMVSSATISDLDGDGSSEVLFGDLSAGKGSLYVVTSEGESYHDAWPVALPNVPAVTPSVGDIDGDGAKDIVIATTREIYVLAASGAVLPGWPFSNGLTKYSFQSPIIADLNVDGHLEIIGAGHGDQPMYFVMDHTGAFIPGWPILVPDGSWTFQPPTLMSWEDQPLILAGRPIASDRADMLYAWRPDGLMAPGFPLHKAGGLEGLISIGDLDGDQQPEMAFSTNLIDPEGFGRIHAYELDGTGELAGFPIEVYGWTYLNGATLGDVDGDDSLDMVVLSYTEYETEPDSIFLYVYELGVPIHAPSLYWPTYKGNNLRDGLVDAQVLTRNYLDQAAYVRIYPNPARHRIYISGLKTARLRIINLQGQEFLTRSLQSDWLHAIQVESLPSGLYFFQLEHSGGILTTRKVFISRD